MCMVAEVQRCRGRCIGHAEVQMCRDADVQRCRGAEVQGCRGADVQRCTDAEIVQRCRCRYDLEVQKCRSAVGSSGGGGAWGRSAVLWCKGARVQRRGSGAVVRGANVQVRVQ